MLFNIMNMKTKKTTYAILALFILMGISSCKDSDSWIPSYIEVYGMGENKRDKDGYFVQVNLPVDLKYDVYDINNNQLRYVDQIRFFYGEIVIKTDIAYPSLSVVAFNRRGQEIGYVNLPRGNRGENIYDGQIVQDFLYDISSYLNMDGFASIEIFVNDVQLIGKQNIQANIYLELKSAGY